jgi:hypothetical protein
MGYNFISIVIKNANLRKISDMAEKKLHALFPLSVSLALIRQFAVSLPFNERQTAPQSVSFGTMR